MSRLLETIGDQDNLLSIDDADFIEDMRRSRDDPTDAFQWSQLRDED